MRKLFFPVLLFFGLLVGGVVLQHEATKRRAALEDSLGGARVGVSLETAAAFARQLETLDEGLADTWVRSSEPDPRLPSVAAADGE